MGANIRRSLILSALLKRKSLFLLGPRQVGKSTLLKDSFPDARFINLLEADTFRRLSTYPESLRESLRGDETLIILDEIQKLPHLLDEVQLLMDRNPSLRFILTGSSARKLRGGKANLLGGRAAMASLHPLTLHETPAEQWNTLLNNGGLPRVFLSGDFANEELLAYLGTYLKEEIQSEGLVRNLSQFSRFLDVVAQCNGEQINYTAVGSDAEVKRRTVMDHFQILYDTLVAYSLPPYQKTTKRKPVATEKFYLFDLGVSRTLAKIPAIVSGSAAYGKSLEQAIFLELRAYLDYSRNPETLYYWRSQSQKEVDFVVGEIAIEVKGKSHVSADDLSGLRTLMEEKLLKHYVCVSLEKAPRKTEDGIEILPLRDFVERLWGDGII